MNHQSRFIESNPEQAAEAKKLMERIVQILDSKKAGNIKVLDVNKQTVIADYFVICTGTSSTHIQSLSGELQFQLKENDNMEPARIDGPNNNDWIVMDYNSVIVHIFNSESREYYKLEKLWSEGEAVDLIELTDKMK